MTSFERAFREYDPEHEADLLRAITMAITETSKLDDEPVICIRTGEVLAALSTAMAATLAMTPGTDVPSHLRHAVECLARRIRRQAAKARAEGVADILGAGTAGHA